MARTKREQSPIGMYHVLLRSEENLFVSAEDKAEFEALCKTYFSGKRKLYSLAMMSDRIHMIFSDGGDGISEIIKPLTTSYARYYNRTYNRTGKLFTDRYKSVAATAVSDIADSVIYVDSTYEVSSVSDKAAFFKDICKKSEYEKRMAGKLEKVCMDSFDTFSKQDIIAIICRMVGISMAELDAMTSKEKREAVRVAAVCKWVSIRRMSEALGLEGAVSRETPKKAPAKKAPPAKKSEKKTEKKPDEKPTVQVEEKEEKPRNNNLSVWLL